MNQKVHINRVKQLLERFNQTGFREKSFMEAFVHFTEWKHPRFSMSSFQKFNNYGFGGILPNQIELHKKVIIEEWIQKMNTESGFDCGMFPFSEGFRCYKSLSDYPQFLFVCGLWVCAMLEGWKTIQPGSVKGSTILKWVKNMSTSELPKNWKIKDNQEQQKYYQEGLEMGNAMFELGTNLWVNSYKYAQHEVSNDPIGDALFKCDFTNVNDVKSLADIMEFALSMVDYIKSANPRRIHHDGSVIYKGMNLVPKFWTGTSEIDYLLEKLEITKLPPSSLEDSHYDSVKMNVYPS